MFEKLFSSSSKSSSCLSLKMSIPSSNLSQKTLKRKEKKRKKRKMTNFESAVEGNASQTKTQTFRNGKKLVYVKAECPGESNLKLLNCKMFSNWK